MFPASRALGSIPELRRRRGWSLACGDFPKPLHPVGLTPPPPSYCSANCVARRCYPSLHAAMRKASIATTRPSLKAPISLLVLSLLLLLVPAARWARAVNGGIAMHGEPLEPHGFTPFSLRQSRRAQGRPSHLRRARLVRQPQSADRQGRLPPRACATTSMRACSRAPMTSPSASMA